MWYGEAKRIYLVPFGRLPESLLEVLREGLQKRYGKETALAPALALPRFAYRAERQQCNSTAILEGLTREARDLLSQGMVLAILECDLYAGGLNFVFGEADPVEGAAVISLARLREEFYGKAPDWELLLDRATKEAVHEVGHLYGLSHCPERRCVMHFSNSLGDTDYKSADFCPNCKAGLNII